MNFKDIFFFNSMLTPKIITLVYWLLILVTITIGIKNMFVMDFFSQRGPQYSMTFGSFVLGIVTIAAGAIFARVWCELLIVLFKIHENIKKIADKDS